MSEIGVPRDPAPEAEAGAGRAAPDPRRWLILATIGVLILETWLAGRVRQPRLAPVEVATS